MAQTLLDLYKCSGGDISHLWVAIRDAALLAMLDIPEGGDVWRAGWDAGHAVRKAAGLVDNMPEAAAAEIFRTWRPAVPAASSRRLNRALRAIDAELEEAYA